MPETNTKGREEKRRDETRRLAVNAISEQAEEEETIAIGRSMY